MKNLIKESDIILLCNKGISVIAIGKSDIVTPLAADKIRQAGMTVVKKEAAPQVDACSFVSCSGGVLNRAVVGCDHTGYKAKLSVIKLLSEKGYEIIDVGTFNEESCDYPDFALAAALNVKEKKSAFAVIIDATGSPSAMTANKIKGIRAAVCYNEFTAHSAREHNNANVLCLGAKALGEETVKSIVEVWISTNFGGGRHQNRLNKIAAIEENKF